MNDDTLEVILEQIAFALFAIAAYLTWGIPAAIVVLGVDAFLFGLAVGLD